MPRPHSRCLDGCEICIPDMDNAVTGNRKNCQGRDRCGIPQCRDCAKGRPDYFAICHDGGRRRVILVECTCGRKRGSDSVKNPQKLVKAMLKKLNSTPGYMKSGEKYLVVPSYVAKAILDIVRGFEILYCGQEYCSVCSCAV